MDRIAILIPCYNEEATIKKVVEGFFCRIDKNVDKIYVYNNNSTDKTLDVLKELSKECDNVLVIRNEYRQGKGNVVRSMFREINAKYYIMVDGDDTYDANEFDTIKKFLFERKADMVIGDRLSGKYFIENKRAFHNFGNALVRFFVNLIFKAKINDVMTGYRGFSRRFVKSFAVLSKGFEIETEMSIHALHYNMDIESFVANYKNRPIGSNSKLNTFSDGIKVILTIFHMVIMYKPATFFGVLSIILFMVSFISYFTNIYNTIGYGQIICIFMGLIFSCIFLVSGVILHYIIEIDKKNFEVNVSRQMLFDDICCHLVDDKSACF